MLLWSAVLLAVTGHVPTLLLRHGCIVERACVSRPPRMSLSRLSPANPDACPCTQARKRGQLNTAFVAAAAAGGGYGSDDEGVRRMAAAVDAAAGTGGGYDSDDAGELTALLLA